LETTEIVPGLYLGGKEAIRNKQKLYDIKISHILSVIDEELEKIDEYKHMHLNARDAENEDLISHFTNTNKFIADGIQSGGVLVHCRAGISRSATIVLAYIMYSQKLPFEEAYVMVKEKRPVIKPNPMFTRQLRIYEKMGNKVDPQHSFYIQLKAYIRTQNLAEEWTGDLVSIKSKDFTEDPESSSATIDPSKDQYACNQCNRKLFTQDNIIGNIGDDIMDDEVHMCVSIEPMGWMDNLSKRAGPLICPKCNTEIGQYRWKSDSAYLFSADPAFEVFKSAIKTIKN